MRRSRWATPMWIWVPTPSTARPASGWPVPGVSEAARPLAHPDGDRGADAVYGPSRKWLAGPGGVGMLCVRPALAARLTPVLPEPEGVPPMRAFESGEAHVAGRVGLVVAVGGHIAARPPQGRQRPAAGGPAAPALLAGGRGGRGGG